MGTTDLRAVYASAEEYLAAHAAEIAKGGLLVRGANLARVRALEPCTVTVEVAGEAVQPVAARIAAAVPGLGVAVVFDGVPTALAELADRLQAPGEEPAEPAGAAPRGTVAARFEAMTAAQKMAQATSGDREVRFALLRDGNKALHAFVLRNPRIGLDEVQWAARLSTLSPEALKLIAEHREWGVNASVCTALVKNPKTPMPLALRLLDRIPVAEVRAIAKGGARDALVHAARKKLNG